MLHEDMKFTRRTALRAGALGAATLAVGGLPAAALAGEADVSQETPLALGAYALNADWLFGGVYAAGDEASGASESGYTTVATPHTVASLSWSAWTDSSWERLWIYRKHLSAAALSGGRAFVDFQGVMTSATVYLNGTAIATHQGGYLPFSVELTAYLVAGDNVLAVVVDGTLQNVPPNNTSSADGAGAVDYLQPAGIYREVALRIEPEVFVSDVFAKPTNVLTAPGLDALVTVDVGAVPSGPLSLVAQLLDSSQNVVGQASQQVSPSATGPTQATVSITGLSGISLWSPESPTLYGVQVTLSVPGAADQTYATRTGFREAVFQTDGFYLNGSRYQIFGLNRHQLFPYTGMAAPQRVQRRDVEILRNELNCNMVRCSHYPQSEWFLDACDELGLMVWEEPPGWGYVNNTASTGPAFKALVLQNVQDMIVRDRSRPSVIVWATRLNETSSVNNEALYAQTNAIAAQYDGTRQTTGAMNNYSLTDWNQQVFAYDDYTYSPMGATDTNYAQNNAALKPPIGGGTPYLVSESVGAIMGAPLYRWIDASTTLGLQAKLHGEAHSQAGVSGYAGLLGWSGIDYASTNGANINDATPPNGPRVWRNLKTTGVLDFFRVFKPGAAIYRAQTQAGAPPAIYPAFVWDFSPTGSNGPNPNGPGANALVFTNCHSIQATVSTGQTVAITQPSGYSNLTYPPFSLDLSGITSAAGNPELTITGLDASGNVLTTLHMSSDTATDTLALTVDDSAIAGDGTDATRFTIQAVDVFGNPRPVPGGQVTLSLSNDNAALISDNPFSFDTNGGSGGGFIQSQPGASGWVTLTAVHPTLAPQGVTATVYVGGASAPAATSTGAGGPPPATSTSAPPPTPPAATTTTASTPTPTTPTPPATTPATTKPKATVARHTAKPATDAAIRALLKKMLLPSGVAAHLKRIRRNGYLATFQAPSAGRLVIGWYVTTEVREAAPPHKKRKQRVLMATATAHIAKSGRARVRIRLTAPGRKLFGVTDKNAKHVTLTAEATFTPKGRRKVSESRRIELKR